PAGDANAVVELDAHGLRRRGQHRSVLRARPDECGVRARGAGKHERGDDRGGGGKPCAAEDRRSAAGSLAAPVPLYEYKCPNGHLFEVIHGMTEESPTACEVCGAAPLQRVLHPVAVHYKGSGFYSTDYGRKGKQASKDAG